MCSPNILLHLFLLLLLLHLGAARERNNAAVRPLSQGAFAFHLKQPTDSPRQLQQTLRQVQQAALSKHMRPRTSQICWNPPQSHSGPLHVRARCRNVGALGVDTCIEISVTLRQLEGTLSEQAIVRAQELCVRTV